MPNRVTELHSIMPINNIPSVLEHGILSHEKVAELPHSDVSLAAVQNKRASKTIPNGLKLHQYANLYFHARNPMMFSRQDRANELCILKISNQVINLPNVVLSDQNAASDYVRFLSPADYQQINFDWVYAHDWTDPDQITQWQKASAKCAEVLVPHTVLPEYIIGAYVINEEVELKLKQNGFFQPITINSYLFFR